MGVKETSRQKKVANLIQQELAFMLQKAIRNQGTSNLVLSITKVKVNIDLSIAKIYLSIFPQEKTNTYLKGIQENRNHIRHDLSKRMKNQLRRMPEFSFYIDDSLDYVDAIEKALKQPENPILQDKDVTKKQIK